MHIWIHAAIAKLRFLVHEFLDFSRPFKMGVVVAVEGEQVRVLLTNGRHVPGVDLHGWFDRCQWDDASKQLRHTDEQSR